jgi:hypothetical protein
MEMPTIREKSTTNDDTTTKMMTFFIPTAANDSAVTIAD